MRRVKPRIRKKEEKRNEMALRRWLQLPPPPPCFHFAAALPRGRACALFSPSSHQAAPRSSLFTTVRAVPSYRTLLSRSLAAFGTGSLSATSLPILHKSNSTETCSLPFINQSNSCCVALMSSLSPSPPSTRSSWVFVCFRSSLFDYFCKLFWRSWRVATRSISRWWLVAFC